jgi:hypothetical protein
MGDGGDGLTRRDFLGGIAATVGAQAIPRRPKPEGGGSQQSGNTSGKTVLTQSDFKYAGLFTLPAGETKMGFSFGAIAGRRVGGEQRLFVVGGKPSGDPVSEVVYPGVGRDALSAPRAKLVRAWGDVYSNKRATFTGGGIMTRGLLWANDQLYWSFGDEYNVAGAHDPSIGATVFTTDGNMRTYGPWRTSETSQKTRGYMVDIPDWFQQYTNGANVAVGAPITAGNASSPWGAMLNAVKFPDNTTAADKVGDAHSTIACQRLVYRDIDHKQTRDTNFKFCGWNQQYDCAQGSWTKPGTPEFTHIDVMSAAAWIDLPNKHGVVFFGQLATAIPGFAYGGGDTLPHVWYGPTVCCHGQNGEPVTVATGPATGSSVPYIWIYNPDDFVRSAQKKTDPWGFEPTAVFAASSISPIAKKAGVWYMFGGAFFDAQSRSLFVSEIYADSIGGEPLPVIHVFTIA